MAALPIEELFAPRDHREHLRHVLHHVSDSGPDSDTEAAMTDATWDDFVSSPELTDAAIVPAVVEAIADAIVGEETWDEWTAEAGATAADPVPDPDSAEPTSTDAVGDQATAEMDAELALASDLVGEGDFAGAYDAMSAAQGFNEVAGDAYDAGYDADY